MALYDHVNDTKTLIVRTDWEREELWREIEFHAHDGTFSTYTVTDISNVRLFRFLCHKRNLGNADSVYVWAWPTATNESEYNRLRSKLLHSTNGVWLWTKQLARGFSEKRHLVKSSSSLYTKFDKEINVACVKLRRRE